MGTCCSSTAAGSAQTGIVRFYAPARGGGVLGGDGGSSRGRVDGAFAVTARHRCDSGVTFRRGARSA